MELLELKKLYDELGEHFGHKLSEGSLKPIEGGFSGSHNYRLQHEGLTYCIRIFPKNQSEEKCRNEINANELAAQHGLAPQVHHSSEDSRWLITDYITGRHMEWPDYEDWNTLKKLISRIKQLHSIKGHHLNRAETSVGKYRRYLKDALENHATLPGQLLKLENKLLAIEHPTEESVFIHNDLNPYNILHKGDSLHFIDWTDAGLGDPYFDLVEMGVFMGESSHQDLLELYKPGYLKKDLNQFKRHFAQRIALFSAWGYQMASSLSENLRPEAWQAALEAPTMPLQTLLRRLLEKEMHLDGEQNFIQFSAICYQNAEEYLRKTF